MKRENTCGITPKESTEANGAPVARTPSTCFSLISSIASVKSLPMKPIEWTRTDVGSYRHSVGEERTIEINRAERETIAALLDLRALDRLTIVFRLNRRGQGRLALQGTLAAAVTQTCVVSLEPVESTLEVPVEVEFWPIPMIDDLAASLVGAVVKDPVQDRVVWNDLRGDEYLHPQ